MDEPDPIQRPPRRPRFSLLTSLLVMTIVGLAIGVWQLWREIAPLRADLRRLRDEVGALSIDDRTKPCAIRVRANDEFTWKWRLWIPEGRSYILKYASEQIPQNGFPKGHGTITLSEPGETWIEYRIAPDPRSGLWMDKLLTPGVSVGSSSQDWVKWSKRTGTGAGVSESTKVFEPGDKIVLARERVSQRATNSSKIEDPSAGFMIWLEPTK
jgi:hypothetical protein